VKVEATKTRKSASASDSAGSERLFLRTALALIVAAGIAASPVVAQRSASTTAGIRITLPAGADPRVELQPGPEVVVLDLPLGAEYPADFSAASNGIVREATVEERDDRVRIELALTYGYLDRVTYEPAAVVISFRSRFAAESAGVPDQERYELGPDDEVRITVHNHADLSGSLAISRDGMITAPLVGEVRAAGLTPRQLAARLTERLDRTYLVDPRVDVEVVQYRSQWVVVGGEVRKPGRVPLRGGTRLKEVIGEAEGFNEFAGDEISISRRAQESDATVTLQVSREDYESGRSNPRLSHGDIVDVRRADACYIQGEVREAGSIRIERGMTLLRALALAGGLTDWANRKNITIRQRDGSQGIYNLHKIESGRIPDPPMRGGEVIIVRKRFL
jgi:polysaccharide export outer membrane protein